MCGGGGVFVFETEAQTLMVVFVEVGRESIGLLGTRHSAGSPMLETELRRQSFSFSAVNIVVCVFCYRAI